MTFAGGAIARAQAVVALVNGEPITQLDVEQRSKARATEHAEGCRRASR